MWSGITAHFEPAAQGIVLQPVKLGAVCLPCTVLYCCVLLCSAGSAVQKYSTAVLLYAYRWYLLRVSRLQQYTGGRGWGYVRFKIIGVRFRIRCAKPFLTLLNT